MQILFLHGPWVDMKSLNKQPLHLQTQTARNTGAAEKLEIKQLLIQTPYLGKCSVWIVFIIARFSAAPSTCPSAFRRSVSTTLEAAYFARNNISSPHRRKSCLPRDFIFFLNTVIIISIIAYLLPFLSQTIVIIAVITIIKNPPPPLPSTF